MSPEKLTALLTCLHTAADIIEAIDNPALQHHRGWDLACWRYHLIPWGVHFTWQHQGGGEPVVIQACLAFDVRFHPVTVLLCSEGRKLDPLPREVA